MLVIYPQFYSQNTHVYIHDEDKEKLEEKEN